MKHARVFHLRGRGLLRRWAGYLLPKAGAVATCAQPNLVRHGIWIGLKLMFYDVTDYEYYITGPETMSVKTGDPPPREERVRGRGGNETRTRGHKERLFKKGIGGK